MQSFSEHLKINQASSGSDKTRNGTERNGTNRGERKIENLFLHSCTPFIIFIQ